LKTIAFPAISTGVYGFPAERAATIAVGAVRECVAASPGLERVQLVAFSPAALEIFERALTYS
jgi:O-acetyl-ADP-ribose deacetylase (regulator of RNase III)